LPAVAAACMAWGLAVWLSPDRLLEYTVVGAVPQQGVVRTGVKPANLSFSDQSAIEAGPKTTLDLDIVGERAALARLTKGSLRVAVRHEEDTDWRFLAGPYEVRVMGTKFELGWDPDQAALSLVMREGKVRVVGPELDRILVAGQELRVARKRPLADASLASAADPARAKPTPQGSHVGAARPGPAEASSSSRNVPPDASKREWTALVSGGRFEEVVREAQTEGFARAHVERDAADVRALAQAAAYTGRTDLAVKTWNVVRQRFRGRSAEQAAFFLGRIYDQQGKSGEALTWLRTYLREAPHGVYASEALGGILTLVRRRDGNAAAQPLARSYLERFPKGSYAAAARAVLDGQ
jgi:TolA-binding protein